MNRQRQSNTNAERAVWMRRTSIEIDREKDLLFVIFYNFGTLLFEKQIKDTERQFISDGYWLWRCIHLRIEFVLLRRFGVCCCYCLPDSFTNSFGAHLSDFILFNLIFHNTHNKHLLAHTTLFLFEQENIYSNSCYVSPSNFTCVKYFFHLRLKRKLGVAALKKKSWN